MSELKKIYLSTDGNREFLDVDNDVQQGLAEVRIKLRYAGTETFDIGGQQLVGIGNSVVQVVHLVISEVPESLEESVR